jgi:hypothetical protein
MSVEVKICPKCGKQYDYISVEPRKTGKRSDSVRHYVYAVHVYEEDGGRRVKKCYLGPAEKYVHVNKVLDLDLTNPLNLNPSIVTEKLYQLIAVTARAARSREDKERAVAKIRLWREGLQSLVKRLELLEREVAPE